MLSGDERYFCTVGDPAMWADQREGKRYQSVASQYGEMGVGLIQASNNRIAGWNRLHEVLAFGDEVPPILRVFSTCHDFIRTFPMLTRHPNKPDDVNTLDVALEDHLADAARYAIQAAPWLDAQTRRGPQSYSVGG